MKRLTIAFDMDGVLVNLMAVAKPLLMSEYGAEWISTPNFSIETQPPLTNSELWKVFRMCYPKYKTTPIFPGAKELFEGLYEASGEPIKIITARPYDAAEYTIKQAMRIADVPVSVDIVEGWENKIKFLANYDFFVEDRRKTAYALAELGKKCFLIDRPYNVEKYPEGDPENVIRIPHLERLHSLIQLAPTSFIQEVNHAVSHFI